MGPSWARWETSRKEHEILGKKCGREGQQLVGEALCFRAQQKKQNQKQLQSTMKQGTDCRAFQLKLIRAPPLPVRAHVCMLAFREVRRPRVESPGVCIIRVEGHQGIKQHRTITNPPKEIQRETVKGFADAWANTVFNCASRGMCSLVKERALSEVSFLGGEKQP